MHTKLLQSYLTLWPHGLYSLPGSLSMGFSRQEYWSGLPSPLPGDLPNPGIETATPASPALAGGFLLFFFITSVTWEALWLSIIFLKFVC